MGRPKAPPRLTTRATAAEIREARGRFGAAALLWVIRQDDMPKASERASRALRKLQARGV